ncbi:lysozyme 1-like [Teleopsis dalmanni]|uniref:lysozyme 1-like n=1 Tax=Teleopsis dalmanni TaxID=139649 RepID=UPI0018CC8E5E|nr:lysozyme 1-like [Teleopsis dalmanni]
MRVASVIIVALALTATALGRTMDRCSLARELYSMGIPYSDLPRWTCIAERESSYRTGVVGPPNGDGSRDHGIFQINSLYWCQPDNGNFSYNGCHINCNALLGNNIRNSITCAAKIKNQQGWSAWSVWRFCNGALPSVNDCF